METNGKWMTQGNLIYKLRSAGFRKGVEQFENEVTVSVSGRHPMLVERIAKFLNDSEPKDEIVYTEAHWNAAEDDDFCPDETCPCRG